LDSEQIVNRKNIGKIFNAPPEEVMDVLTSIAILDENKTWKLLATNNDGFLETYVEQIYLKIVHLSGVIIKHLHLTKVLI